MGALLTVVLLTVAISAACSLLEATLLSTRVATLEAARLGRSGRTAARLVEMKRNIAAPTSAILVLNTVANTAGAAVAGSLAADALGTHMLVAFSAVFTVMILVLSEIVPKTIGAIHWRSLWPAIVWPLAGLQRALAPVVWLTQKLADVLAGTSPTKHTTEGEIAAMIRLGAQVGELTSTELEMMTGVLRFDDMRISEIMVPRREVAVLAPATTIEEAVAVIRQQKHTRYPLTDGELDTATSLVHAKDLVAAMEDRSATLDKYARPLMRVPETMRMPALFREMQRLQRHMAVVLDEHGTATGIVTLEDMLEQIVGEVDDEFDRPTVEPVPTESGGYVVSGDRPVRWLAEEFEVPVDQVHAETLSGLVTELLDRLPRVGDVVDFGRLQLTVLAMDSDRATSLEVEFGHDDAKKSETDSPQPDPA